MVQATGGTSATFGYTPERCAAAFAGAVDAKLISIAAPAIVSASEVRGYPAARASDRKPICGAFAGQQGDFRHRLDAPEFNHPHQWIFRVGIPAAISGEGCRRRRRRAFHRWARAPGRRGRSDERTIRISARHAERGSALRIAVAGGSDKGFRQSLPRFAASSSAMSSSPMPPPVAVSSARRRRYRGRSETFPAPEDRHRAAAQRCPHPYRRSS